MARTISKAERPTTRSLLDFPKLVEAFDKTGVSFVSVTQPFNTTTSMGRLLALTIAIGIGLRLYSAPRRTQLRRRAGSATRGTGIGA